MPIYNFSECEVARARRRHSGELGAQCPKNGRNSRLHVLELDEVSRLSCDTQFDLSRTRLLHLGKTRDLRRPPLFVFQEADVALHSSPARDDAPLSLRNVAIPSQPTDALGREHEQLGRLGDRDQVSVRDCTDCLI